MPVLRTELTERNASFSPDGKWIAYESDESGTLEVFVRAYPTGGKWQVSIRGGSHPKWRRDGRELLYLASDSTMMAAAVPIPMMPETSSPATVIINWMTGIGH